MRRDQIAPARRRYLVRVSGHPNGFALVAPPTPLALPDEARSDAVIADAHLALGRLQGALTHLSGAERVMQLLSRREAVHSSQIEGTRADLSELLIHEATGAAVGLAADVVVIQRYVTALQHGLGQVREGGRRSIRLPLLNELHSLLMNAPAPAPSAGDYRTEQVWIGPSSRIEDATFVPAPPADVPTCMSELETRLFQSTPDRKEQDSLSLVGRLAIAHAQFETIHPYLDGNGRVGRLLFPLMVAAEGFPPLYLSGALLHARERYYNALASVQLRGDWQPWVELLCCSIVQAAHETVAIAGDLAAAVERWEDLLAAYRSGSATRRLPRLLLGRPTISVRQVAEDLQVSQPAANTALNNLREAGILELVRDGRGGRVFQANAIMDRLNQPP